MTTIKIEHGEAKEPEFDAQAAFNDLNARLVVAEAKLEGLMHKVERLVSEAAKRLWHMVF